MDGQIVARKMGEWVDGHMGSKKDGRMDSWMGRGLKMGG